MVERMVMLRMNTDQFDATLSSFLKAIDYSSDVFLDFLEARDQLVRIDLDSGSTVAGEMAVALKPSDRFLSLLSACRAGDRNSVVVG